MRQTNARTRFSPLALIGALLLLCLFPAIAGAQSAAFQDLPRDHWAYKDVDFLIKSGYMDGYPDGTFKGRKV
ncbi:MAG TPA: S-layer homology domain-containing protein, partial [Candidatus Ozemobacteraceae bacterium]|nr:S-layer homology domain-containing protein [Candidatus Ozemobacteraceae bacterium]